MLLFFCKFLEEVPVAVLEFGKVQDDKGLVMGGAGYFLRLAALGGAEGRNPGWGAVSELGKDEDVMGSHQLTR